MKRGLGVELYADVFLVENLIMNYIVIWLSSKLAGTKIKSYRAFLGGAIGAVYALAAFLTGITDNIPGMISKLAVSALIVFAAYGKCTIKKFVRYIISFYISSFLMAGIGLMLIYSFDISGEVTNGVFYWKGEASYFTVIVMVLFGILLVKCALDIFKWKSFKSGNIIEVEINIEEKSINTEVLLDTGNTLKEPVQGKPVLIIEAKKVEAILPPEIKRAEDSGKKDAVEMYTELKGQNAFLIPFTSVGTQAGMLLGIKPNYIKILTGEHVGLVKEVILGLCYEKLSPEQDYSGLINPQMIVYDSILEEKSNKERCG